MTSSKLLKYQRKVSFHVINDGVVINKWNMTFPHVSLYLPLIQNSNEHQGMKQKNLLPARIISNSVYLCVYAPYRAKLLWFGAHHTKKEQIKERRSRECLVTQHLAVSGVLKKKNKSTELMIKPLKNDTFVERHVRERSRCQALIGNKRPADSNQTALSGLMHCCSRSSSWAPPEE